MKLTLILTKPCKAVDKYEAVDPSGTVIKDNPPVGPVYLSKAIANGATRISLTVAVEK